MTPAPNRKTEDFRVTGVASPQNAVTMLDEICEHFVEHAEVERSGETVRLTNEIGTAGIRIDAGRLLIDITCPTADALEMTRTILAEHLFYFAGDQGLDLSWSEPAAPLPLPDLRAVTVTGVEDVTPHMRRVKLSCPDVTPYIDGGLHVRILVPPSGRKPVWPTLRPNGRIGWPEGDDELVVRVYTIRAVDPARGELWIDFLQHPSPGIATPGADFARDAVPGQVIALLGPGGGSIPVAKDILLAGDESALPAIARIVAEMPAGTCIRAIVEVANAAEEQPLPSAATLEVRWLHRDGAQTGAGTPLLQAVSEVIPSIDGETHVWIAGEREDIRTIRAELRRRGHERKRMSVAWYWDKRA